LANLRYAIESVNSNTSFLEKSCNSSKLKTISRNNISQSENGFKFLFPEMIFYNLGKFKKKSAFLAMIIYNLEKKLMFEGFK